MNQFSAAIPMRILSLIAHPRPNSFCHAISDRARNALSSVGHEIVHHDLCAERFEPCLRADEAYSVGDTLEQALSCAADPTVRKHREEIASTEGLLIVHPNWWGKPPARLLGLNASSRLLATRRLQCQYRKTD
jgi:NAD(P)H dehydrogenase (quinone)